MTSPRSLPALPPIDVSSITTLLSRHDGAAPSLNDVQQCRGLLQLKTAWEELDVGPVSWGVSESTPGVVSVLLSNAFGTPEQVKARKKDSVLLGMLAILDETVPSDGYFSLPNACMSRFETDTGLKVVARKVQGARGMRLSLALHIDSQYNAVRFSPSYASMRCIDPITGRFDKSLDLAQKKVLATRMLQDFHISSAQDENYMFDDDLRRACDRLLLQHFESGIRGQERGFLPPSTPNGKRFGIYLTGLPGVGKTTFVGVFARCFERVVRRFLDPGADARIVKVPLNAMTPYTLTNILSIQGISDWSVERVMEQALTKGHTVVLHLEEAPESTDTQDALYHCVEVMLTKLYRRYPEFRSNVLILLTSNYAASSQGLVLAGESVFVRNPAREAQVTWCRRVLYERLQASGCVVDAVNMEHCPISANGDVRPLNSYWLSIGHALVSLYGDGKAGKIAFVRTNDNDDHNSVLVGWQGAGHDGDGVMLELKSQDGFFFFPAMNKNVEGELDAKTQTVLDMAVFGYLTPAVLVLHAGLPPTTTTTPTCIAELTRASDVIVNALRQRTHAANRGFALDTVDLHSHDDERKVLGDPSDIRGGLLKFIDDATNPKIKRQRKDPDVCCILARVNEIGSLLLRELLENGDKSRTHRLGVSKKGLVFVVMLEPGSAMTPQLSSRAHDVRCV